MEILTETFALFVRYFLDDYAAAAAERAERRHETLGRERYEVFVKQIAKRIASDSNLVAEIMGTIVATHPDLSPAHGRGGAT